MSESICATCGGQLLYEWVRQVNFGGLVQHKMVVRCRTCKPKVGMMIGHLVKREKAKKRRELVEEVIGFMTDQKERVEAEVNAAMWRIKAAYIGDNLCLPLRAYELEVRR